MSTDRALLEKTEVLLECLIEKLPLPTMESLLREIQAHLSEEGRLHDGD